MKNDDALRDQLSAILNSHSCENRSNTPDFVLARFMLSCLAAFEVATQARDTWYDIHPRPGGVAEGETIVSQ